LCRTAWNQETVLRARRRLPLGPPERPLEAFGGARDVNQFNTHTARPPQSPGAERAAVRAAAFDPRVTNAGPRSWVAPMRRGVQGSLRYGLWGAGAGAGAGVWGAME